MVVVVVVAAINVVVWGLSANPSLDAISLPMSPSNASKSSGCRSSSAVSSRVASGVDNL